MKSLASILNPTYKQLLGADDWKAFAENIKSTRNACDCCKHPRSKEKQLHVHHLFYDMDRKPWEYDSTEVIVLCSDCHNGIHDQLQQFRKHVFRYLQPRHFQVLNGALAVVLTKYDPLTFVHALAEFVSNERLVNSHAAAWK